MLIKKPVKIQPLFNKILTTMDMYEEDVQKGGVIQKMKGNLKELQTVVSVGDMVRSIKPGDIVAINLKNYAKMKHNPKSVAPDIIGDNPVVQFNPPIVVVNDIPHLFLNDNDVDYIVVESEDEEVGGPTIIQSAKPSILT